MNIKPRMLFLLTFCHVCIISSLLRAFEQVHFKFIDHSTVNDAILVGGANTAKITVNVWDFGRLRTAGHFY